MPVNFTETDQANVDQPKDANETLTDFERGLLIQLGFFDTVEHSWATEIGEYDETQQEFVMSDEQYLTRFPVSERLRIKQERNFYRELRHQQHIDFQANDYRRSTEKDDLIQAAAYGSQVDLSEADLTRELGLGKSYLAHSKEFNEEQVKIKWQVRSYYQHATKPAWWRKVAELRRVNRHD